MVARTGGVVSGLVSSMCGRAREAEGESSAEDCISGAGVVVPDSIGRFMGLVGGGAGTCIDCEHAKATVPAHTRWVRTRNAPFRMKNHPTAILVVPFPSMGRPWRLSQFFGGMVKGSGTISF